MITEASVRLGMARVVVATTYQAMPEPSMIVHHYTLGIPFQILCVRPIGSVRETSTYHARVLTEVNSKVFRTTACVLRLVVTLWVPTP